MASHGIILPPEQDARYTKFKRAASGLTHLQVRNIITRLARRQVYHSGMPVYRMALDYAKGDLDIDIDQFAREVRAVRGAA